MVMGSLDNRKCNFTQADFIVGFLAAVLEPVGGVTACAAGGRPCKSIMLYTTLRSLGAQLPDKMGGIAS